MIGRGTVAAESVNLRKIPDGEVICELDKGACFDVINVRPPVPPATTEWLFVSVDHGNIGYVASRFVEWQRNVPSRPQPRPMPPDVHPVQPPKYAPPNVNVSRVIAVAIGICGAFAIIYFMMFG